MKVPGFPQYISREMDNLELDDYPDAAQSVAAYIYSELPAEYVQRELPEQVSGTRVRVTVANNTQEQPTGTQKKTNKRKASGPLQKRKDKRNKIQETTQSSVDSTATPDANEPVLLSLETNSDDGYLSVHEGTSPERDAVLTTSEKAKVAHSQPDASQTGRMPAQEPGSKIVTLKINPIRLAAFGKETASTITDAATPSTTALPSTTSYTAANRTRDPNNLKIGAKSKPGEQLYPQADLVSAAGENAKAKEKSKRSKKPADEAPVAAASPKTKAAPKTKTAPKTKKAAVPPAAPTRVQPARERKGPAKYRK